ncbi:hypothetical protein PV08_04106 [Exophiala spinifera]|uniref:Zn(2)-C6 fungal-type domain-containing protein n=1 Tax=Exophiala spinifera TaxID=91928 RepID=A0A0D1YP34_9EURO|nr:uncharacterized protein PV08_04106 [Exophiala spinifera]KIW16916.1 hypothetical protein PV08_04106 [Exophiala spinifera]
MDDISDVDVKHERSNPYPPSLPLPPPPPPPGAVHRMPPAETPPLHSYHQSQAAAMPPPAPAWNPAPSPYTNSEPSEHRPPPPDLGHQQPYPPPSQSYPPPPPPPPPPGRETPSYPPDPGYGRPGSVSGPTRSPAELNRPPYHPVSAPHEPPYYQPPQDYRAPHHAYSGPENQPNGTHQPLHVVTGHDMMPSQPPGPPGPYGPPSAGPPATPGPYVQPPYYDPNYQQRRKPVRAAQACDSCRQRKAKCDEGRPECQHCKDNGLKCTYREVPPQKSEKQILNITDKLETMSGNIEMLIQNQKAQAELQQAQAEKINQLLNTLQQKQQSEVVAAPTPDEQLDAGLRQQQQSTVTHNPPDPAYPFRRGESSDAQSTRRPQVQPKTSTVQTGEGERENFELTLPLKHTTAAQNLLNWPSIKKLIPPRITASYVIDEETGRGLLRLYGSGEGEDKNDGHEGAPSPAGSTSSDGRRIDEETSSSPHGVWGTGQIHAPTPSSIPNNPHAVRDHPGGVSPHGGLMLDSDAVDRYFRSYMDHMHILHPFLEPRVIRHMIHTFKRKYSWDVRSTPHTAATIGTKRKREMTESPTPMEEHTSNHINSRPQGRPLSTGVPLIEHSVANAIVLLVIALGKVCSYREPLPGPATTTSMRTSTPHGALYSDLPMPMSAPTSPFNAQSNLNGTNVMSISSPANPQGKNMDAIPGLAYFAKAADILGELPGGTDVSYIQANLLAGLYMGQLARIIPSYEYIMKACMAAQILIESRPYKERTIKPNRRNLINFAFWSCLQLESDIAAEMDLPLSGITRFESSQHKDMPTSVTLEHGLDGTSNADDIVRFYLYQIQLRMTMNSVHSTLYRQSKDPSTRPSITIMGVLDENLENWRTILSNWQWSDDDHESPDINTARMRGKYYGGKYIVWRPAVHYALLISEGLLKDHSDESPAGYGNSELTSPSASYTSVGDHQPPRQPSEMPYISPDLLRAAKMCIQAAIRSTTCFDKVPRRLIVTNIFGTVHAQFGNMLVLYATYTARHPGLNSLIDEYTLKRLHDRTIRILRENEAISPVLAKDRQILEHVRTKVFGPPTSYPGVSTSSSFSSNR